ncbi:MAG: cytochrome c [Bacteroidota bacterium]|nr:hypothetical protein [Odoribacter sp.]MDP3642072.1 cytochrome c [Bacteroidota bacterium]
MKMNLYTIALAGLLITGTFNQEAIADEGAKLFKACEACHSIGGGRRIGPDLKGVTKRRTNDWLVRFIQSPAAVLKSGDADAKAIFKEFNNVPMPDNALTTDQVNLILAHIDGGKGGAADVDPKLAIMQHRIDSLLKTNSQQDILTGYELFTGKRRLENGGAACIACHNATYNNRSKGGNLAKDLTKAYSLLGGFAGIKGLIGSPPFPSMAVTYKNNPVTDEENAYLQLFLKSTDARNPAAPIIEKAWLVYPAFLLSLFIAFVIAAIWFKRKRLSVNNDIIQRQIRYSK